MKYEIRYGKAEVSVYRTHATPLRGLRAIPESSFTGRENTIFGAEIEIVVHGTEFLPAYTQGDNRRVVATDTMKNFIVSQALTCRSATLEGWLHEIGSAFLAEYPHMERLTMIGRQLPYEPTLVPEDGGFGLSDRLFSAERGEGSWARLELERVADGARVTEQESARRGLRLVKITGSSFADFARDSHTTLPERADRPLHIWCDIGWRYLDPTTALGNEPAAYVAGEQVSHLAASVFHEFVSLSIQHLVHEIGSRMLERFPQLAEVRFEAQNRLWDTGAESQTDAKVRVYVEPRPPYGRIGLVMRREGG
jgi:urate oxidase